MIELYRQRIELPRWTHLTCRLQLALSDHLHEFDTARVTAADWRDLNPDIGRATRLMAR
jgi:hypothetical protein